VGDSKGRRGAIESGVERSLDARRERLARATEPYVAPSREELARRLDRFLAARLGGEFRVVDLRPLTGGASKQHFVFELEHPASGVPTRRKLVLRCALSESLGTAPNFQREAEVQRALRGIVPVAEVVCADPEGEVFGAPALVLEFVAGATVPPETAGKPSGFGSSFPRARREALAPAFVDSLAKIHGAASLATLPSFDRPREGTTDASDTLVGWWRRVWEDDKLEDHPMIEVAFDWLLENAPVTERAALIHGDYRTGNFLFDPATNRITAILDWEMSRLGDRHEDLGWAFARIYTAKDEDGHDLVCGLAPREWFLARYAEVSGLPVDPERLFFYEVMNELKIAVIALGTGPRNAFAQQSQAHLSNVVFVGAGYRCVARLRDLLAPRLGGLPR
jgi:aminoglycoside phosphotransferase (APT) family kinase protein